MGSINGIYRVDMWISVMAHPNTGTATSRYLYNKMYRFPLSRYTKCVKCAPRFRVLYNAIFYAHI